MTNSLCLALVRNVEHVTADVATKPDVACVLQRFPTEAAAASDIKNEARLFWLRHETFSSTGHTQKKKTRSIGGEAITIIVRYVVLFGI